MHDLLNLELRAKVLKIALDTEANIQYLLRVFLDISAAKPRAISNRSRNLSFKNRIDLLFDLGILTEDEYNHFNLIAEYRNQFLHNAKCTSFEIASELLDGRKKKLLKFNPGISNDPEEQLLDSFLSLYEETVAIVTIKIEERRAEVEEKFAFMKRPLEAALMVIDCHFDVYDGLLSDLQDLALTDPKSASHLTSLFDLLKKRFSDSFDKIEAFNRKGYIQLSEQQVRRFALRYSNIQS